MALLVARMIVVVSAQWKMPENALGIDRLPALALLSKLGLVCGVDPLDGLLEPPPTNSLAVLNTAVRTRISS
jgi:hypothetical protein